MSARAYTQHDLIRIHLQRHAGDWIAGYELARVEVAPYGWLSHNAGRRAREMATAGLIERTVFEGEVHYRVPLGPPLVADVEGRVHEQPALL